MIRKRFAVAVASIAFAGVGFAQEPESGFDRVASSFKEKLEASTKQLTAFRAQVTEERLPLMRELQDLENELLKRREELQQATRRVDRRALELEGIQRQIKYRKNQGEQLSNLLSEYVRNFESRLHIAELHRHGKVLEAAKLALENASLSAGDVNRAQLALVDASLGRIDDALGGTRFEGSAVDANGIVQPGMFLLIGPAALFRSDDGKHVGTAEQRLGSLEATAIPFTTPEDFAAADQLISAGTGLFPLDASLGDAQKIAATQESLIEHVKKGGPVMVPIFVMAGLALLVALVKWLQFTFLRRPSRKQVAALLEAVNSDDSERARATTKGMKGPVGDMLRVGTANLGEPRELIEESMYEKVLTSRLKLQRMLPFIAICAASAPLLGLLGTVTGIINTFKMITVFGSGDVKSLSGGISEALITTKFGLIVAIPSLLLHAFLSRKAKGVIGTMETTAVAFMNKITRTAPSVTAPSARPIEVPAGVAAPDPGLVREHVNEILGDLLGPLVKDGFDDGKSSNSASRTA